MYEDILSELIQKNETKAVLLVMDGVSGTTINGITELETAKTPNLDYLAKEGSLGLHYPVGYGITPGSGPGHLALFGYDPIKNQIGRGILEALGSGMKVKKGDLAARGNFATMKNGVITDRRAGRISTEKCAELVEKIRERLDKIDNITFDIKAAKDYRFAVVFHGENLFDNIEDADPQKTGLSPVPARSRDEKSIFAAQIVNKFIDAVNDILYGEEPANTCLMRGFANTPDIQPFTDKFGMKAQGIAVYPMYKGLARLVGMDVVDGLDTLDEEIEKLFGSFIEYDFHFLHFKYADSAGEDGNFDRKVAMIEKFDSVIPRVMSLEPDVLVITGDHSTPSSLRLHSWHPVPILIDGKFAFKDDAKRFTEREAAKNGILGHMPAEAILMYILANCGRLAKFGA